jgi:hypothetical protein
MIDDWINNNIKEMKKIVNAISKKNDLDLFQICVEQFLTNQRLKEIPDKEIFFPSQAHIIILMVNINLVNLLKRLKLLMIQLKNMLILNG